MNQEEALVFMTITIIAAGVALTWMAVVNRRRLREMAHRERLAMIDRGLVPPPELDPAGFEAHAGLPPPVENRNAIRSRSAGVMLIGLGFALMLLISFVAGASDTGIGVGGAFVVLGGAFLFNGMLLGRQSPVPPTRAYGSPRTTPPGAQPPTNVAP